MAKIIEIPTFSDERGSLSVIEKLLPFDIKRIYYIYDASQKRGGHRHKTTQQLLICINGSCEIFVNDGITKHTYILNSASNGLLLDAKDWHTMDFFSGDSILLVLASEFYNVNDYIDEKYHD